MGVTSDVTWPKRASHLNAASDAPLYQ